MERRDWMQQRQTPAESDTERWRQRQRQKDWDMERQRQTDKERDKIRKGLRNREVESGRDNEVERWRQRDRDQGMLGEAGWHSGSRDTVGASPTCFKPGLLKKRLWYN